MVEPLYKGQSGAELTGRSREVAVVGRTVLIKKLAVIMRGGRYWRLDNLLAGSHLGPTRRANGKKNARKNHVRASEKNVST